MLYKCNPFIIDTNTVTVTGLAVLPGFPRLY